MSSAPSPKTTQEVNGLPAETSIIAPRFLSDEEITSLARFKALRVLIFHQGWGVGPSLITDVGVERLASLDLPRLEFLHLGYCANITDVGLTSIARMHTVYSVSLIANPNITDDGLVPLLGMQRLKRLDLRGCPGITDHGLEILSAKTDWNELTFGGCENVTQEAVAKLQAAQPTAIIKKDEQEWSYHQDHDNN